MIRQRIIAARIAERIYKNSDLARQLGLEVEYRSGDQNIDNRINDKRAISSAEELE